MGSNTSPNTRLNGGFSGPNFFPNSSAPNNNSAAANQQAGSQRNQLSGVNGSAGTTNSGIGGVNGRELGVGGLETGRRAALRMGLRPLGGLTAPGRDKAMPAVHQRTINCLPDHWVRAIPPAIIRLPTMPVPTATTLPAA